MKIKIIGIPAEVSGLDALSNVLCECCTLHPKLEINPDGLEIIVPRDPASGVTITLQIEQSPSWSPEGTSALLITLRGAVTEFAITRIPNFKTLSHDIVELGIL